MDTVRLHILNIPSYIYLFAALIYSSVLSIIYGNLAIVTFVVGLSFFSRVLISVFSKGSKRKTMYTIFSMVFLVYLVLAHLAYCNFISTGGFFVYSDQVEFYEMGNFLSRKHSLLEVYRLCFVERIHLINEGAIFLFGSIGLVANIFGENSVLIQLIGVSYFAVCTVLMVYMSLLLYVSNSVAFKFTLYYAVFSHVMTFSSWILRDIHISFFYSVAIYLVQSRRRFVNLIVLIALQLVVLEFRTTHGLAFSFFLVFYLVRLVNGLSQKRLLFAVISIAAVSLGSYSVKLIAPHVDTVVEGFERYSAYSLAVAEQKGGFGAKLLKLPSGLKHAAILVYSQFSPFPPWERLLKAETGIEIIFGILTIFVPLYWGLVFTYVTWSLVSTKNILRSISLVLLLFFFLFLLGNSSNLNIRRVMCVYPILYVVFVRYVEKTKKDAFTMFISRYSLFYIFLLCIYSFMKYNYLLGR